MRKITTAQWIKGEKLKCTVGKVIFIICEVISLKAHCHKLMLILSLKSTTKNTKHWAAVSKPKVVEKMFKSCKGKRRKKNVAKNT